MKIANRWEVSTEPVVWLVALCMSAKSVLLPHLNENKMLRTYSLPLPTSNDSIIDASKFYNAKMVEWDQNFAFVYLPIACVFGILYGAFSDRNGRRLPLMIGISGAILDNTIRMLVWSEVTDLDLRVLWVDATIYGFMGGGPMLVMASGNAYVVDKFRSRNALSSRMILFSAMFSLGALLGAQLSQQLIRFVSHLAVMFVIQAILALALLVAAATLDKDSRESGVDAEVKISLTKCHRNGKDKTLVTLDHKDNNGTVLSELTELKGEAIINKKFGQTAYSDIWDSFGLLWQKRPGNDRIMLSMTFLVIFLNSMVRKCEDNNLIGIYTRLAPFNWDTAQFATYKSFRPLIQLMGMIFGVIVLKRQLNFSDPALIILSILSMAGVAILFALATSSLLIYMSLVVGCLNGLLPPLTFTFLAQLVSPDEIGKEFALVTICERFASLSQSFFLQNVYRATIQSYQQFVWWLVAAIALISATIFTFIEYIRRGASYLPI